MKNLIAVLAVCLGLGSIAVPALAETLQLVSTCGESVGGEYVYPYIFSIDNAASLTSLMCLDLNRTITIGETWNVALSGVPLDWFPELRQSPLNTSSARRGPEYAT